MAQPVVAVVGATATGKSRLALTLAEERGGEIVNADALQVYRGLDIGTAKPSADERRRVPHHLIDILDPHEAWSAGAFARQAMGAIDEIRARGAQPMVVGGSGLYLRALLDGISPLPAPDPVVRAELGRRLDSEGLASLRAQLAELDPETERRLAEGDTQRVLRALDVVLSTGRPLTSWIAAKPFGQGKLPAIRIGLTLPRAILYDRIEARVGRMIEGGWLREVGDLMAADPELEAPAFQAIGYRELARHLRGEWTLEESLTRIVAATRRFAKRQATWFRKETDIHWFSALDFERCLEEVRQILTTESPR